MKNYFEENILYYDNHIICAYKPPGMLSQKDITGDDSILEHIKKFVKERFNKPGEVFLGSIHRLDRPAEGLMIFAKTSKALSRMNEKMKKGEIKKEYFAIVEGTPKEPEGALKDFLEKDRKKNRVKRFDQPGKNRKEAKLKYTVLMERLGLSLVDIKLETGRPHQIRAQFSGISCPIVGDLKYGSTRKTDETSICLVSKRIVFDHPVTKEKMDFKVDVPSDKSFWRLFN